MRLRPRVVCFAASFDWFLSGERVLPCEMRNLSLLVASLAFLLGACERHNWEDTDENGNNKIENSEKGTKRLYKEHKDEDGKH